MTSVVSPGVAAVRAAWSRGVHMDCTDPDSIQEALDDLDRYQIQVRIHLFRLLQQLATQPGDALDEALEQLTASADKIIAESPEANMLPHLATYREITARMRELSAEVARRAAEQDVAAQVAEFEERLAEGSLSDAAYCCVRLAKMAADAEEELAAAEAEARRQQAEAAEARRQQAEAAEAAAEGKTGVEAKGEDGAAAAGADGAGAGVSAPRVTAESVALLLETAERCSGKLREVFDDCCDEAVSVEAGGAADTEGGGGGGGAEGGGRLVVRGSLQGGRVTVAELFSALQVAGLRGSYLRRMTARLVSGALEPMLGAPCRVAVQPAAEPGGQAALTWQPLPPGAAAAGSGGGWAADRRGSGGGGGACDPEHCVQLLLRLLATWLLEFDEGMMEVFGGPFWRAAADCYIARVAAPFIAANPEDCDGCGAVAAAAADLEAMAESLDFTSGEEPYLAPAVELLARHALSSRQEKYLQRARQLLLGQGPGQGQGQEAGEAAGAAGTGAGWETAAVGAPMAVDLEYYRRLAAGELQDWEAADPPCGLLLAQGPLVARGTYLVTRRAEALGGLVRELVEDACRGSRAVCRALRGAIGSIALLARALPPLAAPTAPTPTPTHAPSHTPEGASASDSAQLHANHRQQQHQQQPLPRSSLPQLGLLAANDLSYLAEQLLLLAAAYGGQLEAVGGEPAVPELVEEAMALRAAARGVMREQLAAQAAGLDELVAGLDGLRHLDDGKALLRQRRVVQQLLHSLGRLGRAASEVLPPEECVAAAAAALNHVCGQLVAAVLTRSDLSADECGEVAALLGPLGEGAVEAWLGAARAAGPTLSGVPLDVVAAAISARSHQLAKLRCVLQVVSSDSIAAISSAWDSGQLAALPAPELEALLMAISEDSPNRRALLLKLQRGAD